LKNNSIENCKCNNTQQGIIKGYIDLKESGDQISLLSEWFKILGDETRLKIVLSLMEKEICVCEICTAVELSQSAVSHQLKTLRNANLVKNRRDGKMVYYSIDDDHVSIIIKQALVHISHIK